MTRKEWLSWLRLQMCFEQFDPHVLRTRAIERALKAMESGSIVNHKGHWLCINVLSSDYGYASMYDPYMKRGRAISMHRLMLCLNTHPDDPRATRYWIKQSGRTEPFWDAAHKAPPEICPRNCCNPWHCFWQLHPDNCTERE